MVVEKSFATKFDPFTLPIAGQQGASFVHTVHLFERAVVLVWLLFLISKNELAANSITADPLKLLNRHRLGRKMRKRTFFGLTSLRKRKPGF